MRQVTSPARNVRRSKFRFAHHVDLVHLDEKLLVTCSALIAFVLHCSHPARVKRQCQSHPKKNSDFLCGESFLRYASLCAFIYLSIHRSFNHPLSGDSTLAKPIDTISVPSGRGTFINASIWANENEKDGQQFTAYSVTIEKRYQKEGSWHSTSSLNADELLTTAYVATKSFEKVSQLRSQSVES